MKLLLIPKQQFIVPPQLDYLNNTDIDPFVAYIVEFEHELRVRF